MKPKFHTIIQIDHHIKRFLFRKLNLVRFKLYVTKLAENVNFKIKEQKNDLFWLVWHIRLRAGLHESAKQTSLEIKGFLGFFACVFYY